MVKKNNEDASQNESLVLIVLRNSGCNIYTYNNIIYHYPLLNTIPSCSDIPVMDFWDTIKSMFL